MWLNFTKVERFLSCDESTRFEFYVTSLETLWWSLFLLKTFSLSWLNETNVQLYYHLMSLSFESKVDKKLSFKFEPMESNSIGDSQKSIYWNTFDFFVDFSCAQIVIRFQIESFLFFLSLLGDKLNSSLFSVRQSQGLCSVKEKEIGFVFAALEIQLNRAIYNLNWIHYTTGCVTGNWLFSFAQGTTTVTLRNLISLESKFSRCHLDYISAGGSVESRCVSRSMTAKWNIF